MSNVPGIEVTLACTAEGCTRTTSGYIGTVDTYDYHDAPTDAVVIYGAEGGGWYVDVGTEVFCPDPKHVLAERQAERHKEWEARMRERFGTPTR